MTPSDAGEWGVAAAIAAMAVATYAMRAGGFWLMGKVQPSARLRRMLDALPGSVVAATVLPIIATTIDRLGGRRRRHHDAGAPQRPARRRTGMAVAAMARRPVCRPRQIMRVALIAHNLSETGFHFSGSAPWRHVEVLEPGFGLTPVASAA
jgi:hypothetical protein